MQETYINAQELVCITGFPDARTLSDIAAFVVREQTFVAFHKQRRRLTLTRQLLLAFFSARSRVSNCPFLPFFDNTF